MTQTKLKEVVKPLHKNGYEVLPLKAGEKRPSISSWSDMEINATVYKEWLSNGKANGGAGVRLGNGLVALDIDVDSQEMAEHITESAQFELGFAPVRVGRAPRCVLFFRCEQPLTKRKTELYDPQGNKHAVELLGKGQQVVAYGIHPDTQKPYEWIDDSLLDVALVDLPSVDADAIESWFNGLVDVVGEFEGWSFGAETVSHKGDDDLLAVFENNAQPLDMSDDDVVDAIGRYNVPTDYDGWFRFLCACYHQSGGSDKGLEWVLNACSKLDNFDADEIETKWYSGTLANKGDRKPVTFASVLAEVGTQHSERRELAVAESGTKRDSLKELIESADETDLKAKILPKIKKAQLDPFDKEIVAKTIQKRLKELGGETIAIGQIRKMMAPKRSRPDWCEDWAYVNSHGAFFSMEDRNFYKKEAFNIKSGYLVPSDDNGNKVNADRYISEGGYVDVVAGTVYWPGVDEIICRLPMTGDLMVNTFDHRSVPEACDTVSDEGKAAIAIIMRHLEILTGSKEDADILLQWLAFNVQRPGVKLLWSPMIQSIQGVGKSFIGRLLMAALGNGNVGTVSPKQAISDNNGWATNVCVNVLEELKIAGHNRHEAANSLKPLITDPYIQITDKWVKSYNTMNTTNYICFTNFKDAIPLEDNDRRWWVLFCPLEELSNIGSAFGLNHAEYLDELWGALDAHPGCLRRWLLDVELTDSFLGMKQAPMTAHKESMIATEKGSVEWLDEVGDIIEKGGPFYGKMAVSSSDLYKAVDFEVDGFVASNREKSNILKKLGYMKHPKRIKIDGESRWFWTRKSMTVSEIREIFAEVPF